MDWQDARRGWERDVAAAERCAKAAAAALGVTAAVRAFQLAVAAWQVTLIDGARSGAFVEESLSESDRLGALGALAQTVALVVTGALFLSWISRMVRAERTMSPRPIRWTPGDAVWAFIVPFLNLVRPYQVVRDLHDNLDPEAVPEPAPRLRLDGTGGYRTLAVTKAPPPVTLPHASIGAWWTLFLGVQLLGRSPRATWGSSAAIQSSLTVGMFEDLVAVGAALFAVRVVCALTGRLAERHRRLRHASDEELDEWDIPT